MLTNFNSIKVRLEPLFSLGRDTLTEFQFHKGTIRTYQFPQKMSTDCLFQFHKGTIRTEDIYLFYFVRLFQFHKGTIRTSSFLVSSRNLTHFNSIKVRLEHQFPQKMSTDCLFQFHKGTIRTVYSLPTSSHAHNFNSIKVRLEPSGSQPLSPPHIFQFHKGTIRTRHNRRVPA